jgi:hypothetical protein
MDDRFAWKRDDRATLGRRKTDDRTPAACQAFGLFNWFRCQQSSVIRAKRSSLVVASGLKGTRFPVLSPLTASGQGIFDPRHGLFNFFITVKGAYADKPLPASAKPGTRSCHHAGPFEQHIKESPGISFAVNPDIR